MRLGFTSTFTACVLLTACPPPDGQTTETASEALESPSSSTAPTTGETSTTTGEPTSSTPTGMPDEPTTDTTTGDPPNPDATRVVYIPYVVMAEEERAVAVRTVEIVDGVAAAPVTALAAPAGTWLEYDDFPVAGDSVFPVYTGPGSAAQLWLIDLATSTSHPVELPPGVMRVHDARVSRDRSHLIVQAGPEVSPGTASFFLCELAGTACTLAPIPFELPPMTRISKVTDVSQADGWILHERRTEGAKGVDVRLADLDDPASAAPVASFSEVPSPGTIFAPDSKAVYLIDYNDGASVAVDISTDPPGPPVPLHPGLPVLGQVNLIFAPDMASALVWSGPGNRGDLHHITLDGADIGPLVPFNTGGPEHVHDEFIAFTADGEHVLLLSDHETKFAEQTYLAELAAPEVLPVRVNSPLAENRKVTEAFVLPDPTHAIYMVGPDPKDIFRASLDPIGEVVQLNPPDHDVTQFCMLPTPDGQHIIYSASSADPDRALYLVDIGAPQPGAPVELTTALPAGMEPFADYCALTPDAGEVLFVARDADGPAGLYMTPIAPEVGAAIEVSTPGDIVRVFASL